MTITLLACGGGENDSASDPGVNISALASANNGNKSESDGGANNSARENTNNAGSSAPIISATNPGNYIWSNLTIGTAVYIDRNYTYSKIPSVYEGFKVLQTANNDKSSTGDVFISFEINQSATIYVAHVADNASRPSWLSSWTNTGDSMITTDRRLFVYKKDFSAGNVILGGNGGAASMYTIFIAISGADSKIDDSTSGSSTGGNTSDSTSGSSTGGNTSDSTSGSSGTGTGTGNNDVQIIMSWDQNSSPLIGYKIYYGSSPESASTLLSDILITSKNFIPEKPSVTYDAVNELGLKIGDSICFRIKAYNMTGMADFSSASCVTI